MEVVKGLTRRVEVGVERIKGGGEERCGTVFVS